MIKVTGNCWMVVLQRVLATQTQTTDEVLVTLAVLALQIIKQLTALVDHAQQTLAGMMITLVLAEMVRQMLDVG